MFCPRCSAETVDPEQRFCKGCGTNLQQVATVIEQGPNSLDTYRLDFEGIKRSVNEMGRSFKAAMDSKRTAPDRTRREEIKFKRDMLTLSRVRNLQLAVLNIISAGSTGAFFYYLIHKAIESGLIRNLEGKAGVYGIEPVVGLLWLVALLPLAKGIGHLINGVFLGVKLDKLSSIEDKPTNPLLQSSPPFSITEQPTARYPNMAEPGQTG